MPIARREKRTTEGTRTEATNDTGKYTRLHRDADDILKFSRVLAANYFWCRDDIRTTAGGKESEGGEKETYKFERIYKRETLKFPPDYRIKYFPPQLFI